MILKQDLGEVWFKVNYWGPGLAGKTTNLGFLWESFHRFHRAGDLASPSTETDINLFTELLPKAPEESQRAFQRRHRDVWWQRHEKFIEAMPINQALLDFEPFRNLKLRVRVYTIPGPVFYDSLRRMTLEGTDGVIFIADSQVERMEANVESLENLKACLLEADRDPEQVPLVLQFNKRDLRNVHGTRQMNKLLNPNFVPWFEAVAATGIGVLDTLHALVKLMRRNAKDAFKGA